MRERGSLHIAILYMYVHIIHAKVPCFATLPSLLTRACVVHAAVVAVIAANRMQEPTVTEACSRIANVRCVKENAAIAKKNASREKPRESDTYARGNIIVKFYICPFLCPPPWGSD